MISVTKLLLAKEYQGDELRYRDGASQMRHGASEGKGPVVAWNMTRTCNLRCRHCYMSADAEKHAGELTTAEAKRFIDDLAAFHVPALLLSGGAEETGEYLFRNKLLILSNAFAPSGLNGIATMLQYLFHFSIGYFSLIVNVPLAVRCALTADRRFSISTSILWAEKRSERWLKYSEE